MKQIKIYEEDHKELDERIRHDYRLRSFADIVRFLIKNLKAHELNQELEKK